MRVKPLVAAVSAVALGVVLAGCGSSGGSGGAAATKKAEAGAPIKLGVVTSLTGGYASGYQTVERAVKARLAVANANGGIDGHKLTYVMADDTSTAAGALTATQTLIQQDKVYGILDVSPVFFGGAPAAKAAGMPVTGVSFDGGPEWLDKSYSTFFPADGYSHFDQVADTYGKFYKNQGCTKAGAIGNTGPSSGRAATGSVISAEKAGIARGYLQTKLQPGTTDIGPEVIALKNSGTDCLYIPTTPSLAFAVVAGLKQAGVHMKAIVLPTGYGGDILNSKSTVQAAQGVDFQVSASPVEADTDATKAFQAALSKYAGVTGVPTFGDYVGWETADLFIYGLQQAGGDASQAQFVSKLRASTTWDQGGLYAQPVNFADPQGHMGGLATGNCTNLVKLTGDKFVPIEGAMPICGDIIEGAKVDS